MDTSNDNIRKLFDMLDNPAAYSEQEIHEVINCKVTVSKALPFGYEKKRLFVLHSAHLFVPL
jgi:hypothetical protein